MQSVIVTKSKRQIGDDFSDLFYNKKLAWSHSVVSNDRILFQSSPWF